MPPITATVLPPNVLAQLRHLGGHATAGNLRRRRSALVDQSRFALFQMDDVVGDTITPLSQGRPTFRQLHQARPEGTGGHRRGHASSGLVPLHRSRPFSSPESCGCLVFGTYEFRIVAVFVFNIDEDNFVEILQRHLRRGLEEIGAGWRKGNNFFDFLRKELVVGTGADEDQETVESSHVVDVLHKLERSRFQPIG